MNFSAIPDGHDIFLDTNTFVYFFSQHATWGAACEQLLERVARQDVRGFTSTHVLSELAHRLMTIEAMDAFGWPFAGIAQRLRHHPADVRTLNRFHQAVQDVPRFGVQILTIPASLIDSAAASSQQTGLLSNDALIVAVMQANGLTHLASNDVDFDRVPGLTRFAPA